MLDTLTYSVPPTVVKVPVRPVNGHGRRAFKHLSKSQRAALAVAVIRGEAALQPTLRVVSGALNVSITYIGAALKLTPDQLRQLRWGYLTLADFKPAAAPEPVKAEMTVEEVADWWGSASETDRAAVVSQIGIAPLWDKIAETLD
jgi:hypothetical protein